MAKFLIVSLIAFSTNLFSNQTEDLSPLLAPDALPFRISIVQEDFQLPSDEDNSYGLQSFVYGVYNGKGLLLAGRSNGVHSFNPDNDNFTILQQNKTVYVIDPIKKTVVAKSLLGATSGLTQAQIDTLAVTSSQYHQVGNTLYMIGGYGYDTAAAEFNTKSTLTAIDIPGLMHWVEKGGSKETALQHIRQTSHPLIQVAGGFLTQASAHDPFLLIFGQNFSGFYRTGLTGVYTNQVRPFQIIDNGRDLYVKPGKQFAQDPNCHRRDLNVLPIMKKVNNSFLPSFVALSGVFTEDVGVWTVPVLISSQGETFMPDPTDPNTFKQGMNNYDTARIGLFSKNSNEMYLLLFGGISYLSESGGTITADAEIPFINNVTTVKIDAQNTFSQYLMEDRFPEILSDFANPGNTLLFGAEGRFFPVANLPMFANGVFSLDSLGSSPVLLGYIVGGIQSTVPNTTIKTDASASPYIFSVMIERR